jgi:phage gpG-like protein
MKQFASFEKMWEKLDEKIDLMKKDAPDKVGHIAQRFFADTFKKQGWEGEHWKPRMYDKKKKDIFRAILVKTGDLRDAVAHSLASATWDKILFEVRSKYGAYHNEGFKGAIQPYMRSLSKKSFKANPIYSAANPKSMVQFHDRNLPKREFMGDSPTLNNIILEYLNKKFLNCFK